MIKIILACVFFVIGFLTVLFFWSYKGTLIHYPFMFGFTGILFFAVGWQLLRSGIDASGKTEPDERQEQIKYLKTNGERIKVDLSKCEVKESMGDDEVSWPENNLGPTTVKIAAQDGLSEANGNTGMNYPNLSVIVFCAEGSIKSEKFTSDVLPFDCATLSLKLIAQKETTLYVNRLDRSKYYFDTDFLFPF